MDDADLRGNIRFNTEVTQAVWSDAGYTLRFGDGHLERFDALVSAVGFLNVPSIPTWPGAAQFRGRTFHSAEWPSDADLSGKRVAIVGTGSTSVQIVGEIASEADRLLVFQRQPNWILPKGDHDFSDRERRRLARASYYRWRRFLAYLASEHGRSGGKQATEGARANRREQAIAETHLRSALGHRPDLIKALLPDYPFYGKRPVINDTFYPALDRDNVRLVPHAVIGLDKDGVIDASGKTHQVDVLILATGFQAANYLKSLRVVGQEGRSLQEVWDGEPEAYLGITVPGFPNFFMLYGPNTNAGPVPMFLECQASVAAKMLRSARRSGGHVVDTSPTAMRLYNKWVQARLARTVWGRTANYFTSASGRVVTQWPTGATQYWVMTLAFRRLGLRLVPRNRPAEPPRRRT